MTASDPSRSNRMMTATLQMKKIDLAVLKRPFAR